MRIGALAAGYSGLDAAVMRMVGGEVAWFAEKDEGASRVLAAHYPGVTNLGDITAIDWATVPPVEIVTAGFPCQDVSAAGKKAGLQPGNRTGLWFHIAYAIAVLRPSLVVLENVRGILSTKAHSDMEPCPDCMGDGEKTILRALGAVVGDLATIGYDASWEAVRAAEAGAPHRRDRVFVLAWPADAELAGS